MRKSGIALPVVVGLALQLGIAGTAATAQEPKLEDFESSSWLILNGELIPPPWDFRVEGGKLFVNGRDAFPPKPPQKVPSRDELPEKYRKMRDVLHAANVAISGWLPENGFEETRRLAVLFLRRQPFVRSAEARGDAVYIRWRESLPSGGIQIPRDPWGFWPKPPPDPTENMKHIGNELAEALRRAGTLVVCTGGYEEKDGSSGAERAHRIRDILRDVSDPQERIERLREVFHDEETIRLLAERWSRQTDKR